MSNAKKSIATTSPELLRRGAAAAILCVTAAIHVVALPSHIRDAPLIGLVIGLAIPVCVSIASWLWATGEDQAWLAASGLMGAFILAFLLSRTIGLPGFDRSGMLHYWTEGLPALIAEFGLLGLASEQWSSMPPRLTALLMDDDF
jgi:hypothetical protein